MEPAGSMAREKAVSVILVTGGNRRDRARAMAEAIRRLGAECGDPALRSVVNHAATLVDRYRV